MRRRAGLLGLTLLFAAAAGDTASAQHSIDGTQAALESCLADAKTRMAAQGVSARVADERRACVFLTTERCEGLPEAECADRERAVWDARLNRTYRELRAKAPKPIFERIQATQRTWVPYRDSMCDRFFTKDAGSMAHSASRSCVLKETAWRALALEDMLADLSRSLQ